MAQDVRPWCNICGHDGPFRWPERPREGHVCGNCSASSRQRALLYVLGAALGQDDRPLVAWHPLPEVRVLEASGRGAYSMLLAQKLRYCNSAYRPNRDGDQHPWGRHADLERLAYPDASLDIVLAADVFEHVREDGRAFAEIHRVLRPGGLIIFTVPYEPQAETLVRVRVDGDADVELMEPEYHGSGGRSLAYRTYGRDLPDRLRAVGFSVGLWEVDAPHHAIAGQLVFICTKGSYVNLGRLHRTESHLRPSGLQATPLIPFRLWVLLKANLDALRQLAADIAARFGR
jgi:SAM-dependent methyltransferase